MSTVSTEDRRKLDHVYAVVKGIDTTSARNEMATAICDILTAVEKAMELSDKLSHRHNLLTKLFAAESEANAALARAQDLRTELDRYDGATTVDTVPRPTIPLEVEPAQKEVPVHRAPDLDKLRINPDTRGTAAYQETMRLAGKASGHARSVKNGLLPHKGTGYDPECSRCAAEKRDAEAVMDTPSPPITAGSEAASLSSTPVTEPSKFWKIDAEAISKHVSEPEAAPTAQDTGGKSVWHFEDVVTGKVHIAQRNDRGDVYPLCGDSSDTEGYVVTTETALKCKDCRAIMAAGRIIPIFTAGEVDYAA